MLRRIFKVHDNWLMVLSIEPFSRNPPPGVENPTSQGGGGGKGWLVSCAISAIFFLRPACGSWSVMGRYWGGGTAPEGDASRSKHLLHMDVGDAVEVQVLTTGETQALVDLHADH